MKLARILSAGLLAAAGWLSAADSPDPKIAELGEKMKSAAAASEEVFIAGLLSADMRSKRQELLSPMPELRRTSAQLSRQVRFNLQPGCDGTLLCNWRRAIELEQLLDRQISKEQVDFTAKLEPAAEADSAFFAKNCIMLALQLPNRYTLNDLKTKRDCEEFQKNLEFLFQNLKRRSIVPMAEQWQIKVQTALFLYWQIRQNAAMLQEDPEQLGKVDNYLLRQLNDVKNLSCCVCLMQPRSPVNQEFNRKLTAIRGLCSIYTGFLRRQRDGKELQKYFAEASKLEMILPRWIGKTPYFFYWGNVPVEELGDQAAALLLEQIPATLELVAQKNKEKAEKDKQARAEKKKKEKQDRMHGKRSEKKEDPPADAPGAPAPPAAKPAKGSDPFPAALTAYNTDIFESGGNLRREAKTAVSFKKDMTEFARILSNIAKGAAEVQTKYPDAVLISAKPGPAAGKTGRGK